jgi:SHS2 domain-containing protein
MPYQYLPDIAIADVAFEAWSDTLEGLFLSAADATMNVMVADLSTIVEHDLRTLTAADGEVDMLLFQLLQELIFYKDAERLLLRVQSLVIRREESGYSLLAEARGEEIDPLRHDLVVDVKAVTLHRFCLAQSVRGWEVTVVLDI